MSFEGTFGIWHVDLQYKVGDRVTYVEGNRLDVLVIASLNRKGYCQLRELGPIESFDGKCTDEIQQEPDAYFFRCRN